MIYEFENIKTGEIRLVNFNINDKKVYKGENGNEEGDWRRVFSAPNIGVDSSVKPFSKEDFLKKTKNVKTYGEAWKISEEYSQRRADKLGTEDPIKQKAEKDFYKPKRKNEKNNKRLS